MKRLWLLLVPLVLFSIAYLYKSQHHLNPTTTTNNSPHTHSLTLKPNCVECFERYIEEVINKGLDIFHYPSGPMPPATVSPQDAKKIAAFMATLQGFTPTHPEWVQEGKALFYGNCTGCHGPEGKGQKGYFPDLTKRPLEGYQKLMKK